MTTFGDRLRTLRREEGLSQEELAAKLKVSRSCIGNYEKDVRLPKYEDLEAIADFFNVDTDFLRGKTDQRNQYTHDLLSAEESEIIDLYRNSIDARVFLTSWLKVMKEGRSENV
jgi:transcriptional regulator with XRE-family HTH domain